MYIIVGLGNPGKSYEKTRHNIGYIVLDKIAEEYDIKVNKIKHKALVGEGFISGQKVLLVKPQTFMNLSGNSVREILEYYKILPENLIVIYDDVDLPVGSLRIRKKGSGGTHNGMNSILYDIQSEQFPRIRIGIGAETRMDLKDFVLGNFGKEEKIVLKKVVLNAAKAAACIIDRGIEIAMGEYNAK